MEDRYFLGYRAFLEDPRPGHIREGNSGADLGDNRYLPLWKFDDHRGRPGYILVLE